MYSWEIENFFKNTNYSITPDDYQKIVTESPQINHIKYEPYSNDFIISTDDNYTWRFKINNKRKER